MSATNVTVISRLHLGPKHLVITHSHTHCQYQDTSEQLSLESAFFAGHHAKPISLHVISYSQPQELMWKKLSCYQSLLLLSRTEEDRIWL